MYPIETLSDVGSIDNIRMTLDNLILSLSCAEIWKFLGVIPPRSVLLHGPPGFPVIFYFYFFFIFDFSFLFGLYNLSFFVCV